MEILIVTPYCFPEGSGLECYAHDINAYLRGRGHGVLQVCGTHLQDRKEAPANVTLISHKPHLTISNTPVRLGLVRELVRVIKQQKPKIIFAHTPVPFFADSAATASRKTGVPLVLCYHAGSLYKRNILLDSLSFMYAHSLEPITLKTAKKIIVYNPYLKEVTLKNYSQKIVVVKPTIDSSLFSPNEDLPGSSLLFAGQLSKAAAWKGLDHVLSAVEKIPHMHLRVAGGGDRLDHFKEQAHRMGIAHRVHFLGQIPREEMPSFYRSGSLLVYTPTTQNDASPMVLLEALGCGIPVVSIRMGGIPYLVRHGEDGILIDAHSELPETIIRVLQDKAFLAQLRKGALETAGMLADEDGCREVEEALLQVADGNHIP